MSYRGYSYSKKSLIFQAVRYSTLACKSDCSLCSAGCTGPLHCIVVILLKKGLPGVKLLSSSNAIMNTTGGCVVNNMGCMVIHGSAR